MTHTLKICMNKEENMMNILLTISYEKFFIPFFKSELLPPFGSIPEPLFDSLKVNVQLLYLILHYYYTDCRGQDLSYVLSDGKMVGPIRSFWKMKKYKVVSGTCTCCYRTTFFIFSFLFKFVLFVGSQK